MASPPEPEPFSVGFHVCSVQAGVPDLKAPIWHLKMGQPFEVPPFCLYRAWLAMLSSVLNSKRAIQVNIAIVRAFMKLREVLATHKELIHRLEAIERTLASHGTLHKPHA